MHHNQRFLNVVKMAVLGVGLMGGAVWGGDWYRWRGPEQNGVSREKNLPSEWEPPTPDNPQGKNVLWVNNIGGMSAPIVMNGKLYTMSRVNEVHEQTSAGDTLVAGQRTQESVVCVDAETGKPLWEHRENMTQTDVPFWRIGWGNPAGDPQSNRVFVLGTQCAFNCFDAETGKVLWKHQMTEEYGLISTFGGRTPSPAVDDDTVYITGIAFGWGDNARGQHRVFAFNKMNGELLWTAGTGFIPSDSPQNTPVITVVNGQKILVLGTGDGGVHAWKARTGEKLWSFHASKRGSNASVIVDAEKARAFACTDLDNYDSTKLGRVVCIDFSKADLNNPPKEVWRIDGLEAGFATPAYYNGILYVADNMAIIHAIDANNPTTKMNPGTQIPVGKELWKKNAGRIGKGSVVYADGKLYYPEANGRFTILDVSGAKPKVLSDVRIEEKMGREYAIYGSVAIANGRVYILAANKTYCIGEKNPKVESDPIPPGPKEEPVADVNAAPAVVQVIPADVVLRPGEKQTFVARAFDNKGRFLRNLDKLEWSVGPLAVPPPPIKMPNLPHPNDPVALKKVAQTQQTAVQATQPAAIGNLAGAVDGTGTFTAENKGPQGGGVYAAAGNVKGFARVRVLPPLPWKYDFEKAPVGKPPMTWLGAGGKFAVEDQGGNKVLTKLTDIPLYARARTNFGSPEMSNYTVQADIKVKETTIDDPARPGQKLRKIPDAGVINQRYVLELRGSNQDLCLQIWSPALPMSLNRTIPFEWKAETWYRQKLMVQQAGEKAIIKGKVWLADQKEPAEWTVEMEDSQPNRSGNPGLWGFSNDHEIYYDNIIVTENAEK